MTRRRILQRDVEFPDCAVDSYERGWQPDCLTVRIIAWDETTITTVRFDKVKFVRDTRAGGFSRLREMEESELLEWRLRDLREPPDPEPDAEDYRHFAFLTEGGRQALDVIAKNVTFEHGDRVETHNIPDFLGGNPNPGGNDDR